MNAYTIVDNLRSRGFLLTAKGGGLIDVRPASRLTNGDRALIRRYKPEILRGLEVIDHVAFDGIFPDFDRVAAALLKQESPEEKAYNDRLAQADGWDPSAPSTTVEDESPDGFLDAYTQEHADRIYMARTLVLDLETTGLSPFAEQVKTVDHVGHRRFRRSRPIDTGGFFPQVPADFGNYYLDDFPKCRIDTTRRIRIISVQLVESGWTAAWDLDQLSAEDRQQLAYDVLQGKIIVGHNLSFDLNWLSWMTDAKPVRILDSMLIAKWHAHASRLEIHRRAAEGDEVCRAFVKKAGGAGAGFSLAQCAAAFGLPVPDKILQLPYNWCVSDLSPAHFEYCCGDVALPLDIIRAALKLESNAGLDEILAALDGGLYASDCEPALINLMRAHRLGMPISPEAIESLNIQLDGEMAGQAALAIAIAPDIFGPVRTDLQQASITEALRQAIEIYLQAQGKRLPMTDKGNPSLAEDALIKEGLSEEPFIAHFLKITEASSTKKMLKQWLGHIGSDGRVHPLISISTVPGRMASEQPNSQGLPKKASVRSIIKAAPGHLIIAADYSQIELRFAAAMVKRELATVAEYLDGHRKLRLEPWIRRALEDARNRHARGGRPPALCSAGSWRDVQAAELSYAYFHALRSGPAMANALNDGLDLHLLTAIGMAARTGKVHLDGLTEIEFLRAANQKKLRAELAAERQSAKAVNFGLIYGQSATGMDGEGGLYAFGITGYGLDWSQTDAEAARNLWFDKLYPEFRWWHAWSRLALVHGPMTLMLRGYNGLAVSERAWIWMVTTLSGREMLALDKRTGLNYPVQGSGVELILKAMARLPEPANSCLINVIHDELLFEAPIDQAETVRSQVVKIMRAVGDEMLSPYGVPVEVEATVGDSWGSLK